MTTAHNDFGRGLYGAAEIERYVAFVVGTDEARNAQRYLRNVVSDDSHVPGRPDYSFHDLVSTFTVARLHKRGVTLRKIRAALECAQKFTETTQPFAFQGLYTDGRDVFVDLGLDGQRTNLNGPGHPANGQETSVTILVDLEQISFREGEHFAERAAQSWQPVPGVEVDPHVLFGAPRIAGTRVATATVAEWENRGMDVEEMADEFELNVDGLRRALAFEHDLRERKAA